MKVFCAPRPTLHNDFFTGHSAKIKGTYLNACLILYAVPISQQHTKRN